MSSGSCDEEVKKVVNKIVDDVVKELEGLDMAAQPPGTAQQAPDSEHRRSSRCRKEPDRLAKNANEPKKKEDPVVYELVMAPVSPFIRGILKPSPNVTVGKAIGKKSRKVRILRRLKYKVIPPLDGWRPDRKRLPDEDPDEEEQQRLDAKKAREEAEKAAEWRKRRRRERRKSRGIIANSSDSDEADEARSPSPDIFYYGYIKRGKTDFLSDTEDNTEQHGNPIVARKPPARAFSSSDDDEPGPSTHSNKRQERRPSPMHIPTYEEMRKAKADRRKSTMFPVIPMKESSSCETKAVEKADKSVGRRSGMVLMERTTTKVTESMVRKATALAIAGGGDTGGKKGADEIELTRGNDGQEAQSSEKNGEGTGLAEKAEMNMEERRRRRRASQMEMPDAAFFEAKRKIVQLRELLQGMDGQEAQSSEKSSEGTPPVQPEEEEKAKAKGDRRKSKVFPVTQMKESLPLETKAVEKADKSVRRRSGMVLMEKTMKVTEPVEKADKSVRRRSGMIRNVPVKKEEAASSSTTPFNEEPCRSEEQMKADEAQKMERKKTKVATWLTRNDTADAMAGGGEKGEKGADETAKSDETGRKGRRSMKTPKGKENEKVESKSKSESGEKHKSHPFFSQFAPKPTQSAVSTVLANREEEKKGADKKEKAARRKSMFIAKKEEEEAVVIVAEITKEEKEREYGENGDGGEKERETTNDDAIPPHISHPSNTTTSIWPSSEIDEAPYAGLVHAGRDKKKVTKGDCEEEDAMMKMKRFSVKPLKLSSYSIPSSLRSEDPEPVEIISVFDEERKESLSGGDATIGAVTTAAWPKNIRPHRVEDCLGDMEMLADSKKWMQKWKKRLDASREEDDNATKPPKAKRKKRKGGAYSDESEQEDSDDDYEMTEEEHRLPNPLILSGPIGCGKTTYIHALSEEIGFSILESSPDEKRTGGSLRTKLLGAVANYRMPSKSAGSIASFFSKKTEGEEKKEEKKKGRQHTLVVIEHVDVVFAEEDKLFWPALSEIITSAKIPIVLICNVVPDELSRVLRQVEEAGGEPMEMRMERPEGKRMADYVMASLTGPCGRALSSTVVPAIVSRARGDLRAVLRDSHWAAVAASLSQADLVDRRMRRVDESTMCDTVARQTFAWTDECERRAEAMSANEMTRAAEWPARCGMPGEVYTRLCTQIDKMDEDAYRVEKGRADRMMEMARSGITTGSGGRSRVMTRGEIAMDWMPILECMDRNEQEKKKMNGRRYLHYFNAGKDGAMIDPLGQIQRSCAFFRLPQSNNPQ